MKHWTAAAALLTTLVITTVGFAQNMTGADYAGIIANELDATLIECPSNIRTWADEVGFDAGCFQYRMGADLIPSMLDSVLQGYSDIQPAEAWRIVEPNRRTRIYITDWDQIVALVVPLESERPVPVVVVTPR